VDADTGARARAERIDPDTGARVGVDGRARVDADTGARVDAGRRVRIDSDGRVTTRLVTPTRIRTATGFQDGLRFWNGSNWIWGYGPRYGFWDGFGWGYGPWDRYGSFWGGYAPGYGYWDDFYSVPYAYASPMYSSPPVVATPAAPRTALGITMDERDRAVFVRTVVRGGPAEAAGLRVGDMILAINGESITTADQVRQIVAEHQPGDQLDIDTDRNGREVRTAAMLEEHARVF
jgi:hypothetical protein